MILKIHCKKIESEDYNELGFDRLWMVKTTKYSKQQFSVCFRISKNYNDLHKIFQELAQRLETQISMY